MNNLIKISSSKHTHYKNKNKIKISNLLGALYDFMVYRQILLNTNNGVELD